MQDYVKQLSLTFFGALLGGLVAILSSMYLNQLNAEQSAAEQRQAMHASLKAEIRFNLSLINEVTANDDPTKKAEHAHADVTKQPVVLISLSDLVWRKFITSGSVSDVSKNELHRMFEFYAHVARNRELVQRLNTQFNVNLANAYYQNIETSNKLLKALMKEME